MNKKKKKKCKSYHVWWLKNVKTYNFSFYFFLYLTQYMKTIRFVMLKMVNGFLSIYISSRFMMMWKKNFTKMKPKKTTTPGIIIILKCSILLLSTAKQSKAKKKFPFSSEDRGIYIPHCYIYSFVHFVFFFVTFTIYQDKSNI